MLILLKKEESPAEEKSAAVANLIQIGIDVVNIMRIYY